MPLWLLGRARYIAFAVATIAIGLAVHLRGDVLPLASRDVLGDALWAAMAVWFIAAIAPLSRPHWRAAVAFALCCLVEFSQLWHLPVLDEFRRTTLGHLVLGSGFDPRDFAAYAAGVLAAVLVERATKHRRSGTIAVTANG
jgi:hypothetical protein